VANKGGLAIGFKVAGTSLAFVSCHLAAHEGEKYRKRRNDNCKEILNGARLGVKAVDMDHQFHHVFWFGVSGLGLHALVNWVCFVRLADVRSFQDLNYRIDPSLSSTLSVLPWNEVRACGPQLRTPGGLRRSDLELVFASVSSNTSTSPTSSIGRLGTS
jgi:hypothetical protein